MQFTNIIVLCALLPALGLGAPAPAKGGAAAKVKAALGGAKAKAGAAAAGGAAAGGASAGSNASNGTASAGNASAGNASNNGTASAGNAASSSSSASASTTSAANAQGASNNAGGQNAAQSSTSSAYANAASAQAVINPKFNGGNPPIDVTIAKESVGAAVNGWQADTGMVSNWLNTATSLSGDAFTQGATLAYNAEVNELNHKAVLDKNLPQSAIAGANDTLAAQGSFQAVVDSLQAMISEGPGTAQARVAEINNNRCVNVLPNINSYFAAAGSSASTASVPTGCAGVAATNSISVVPTELPGQIGQNGPANNAQAGASTTSAPNAQATGNNAANGAQSSSSSSSQQGANGASSAKATSTARN